MEKALPWGNGLLIRPTCTVGLPVSFSQYNKLSVLSGMFWRAAMLPGGTRGALREHLEEGSAVDQIQVLLWSNTVLPLVSRL